LHTNDAPSAITRLIDMGIKPFLVASSVQAILAQRLIRVICSECKQPHKNPDPKVLRALGFTDNELQGKSIYHGAGCESCSGTGYRGRQGVFELLVMTPAIMELAFKRAPLGELRRAARATGMRSLVEDGRLKILNGITTPEELIRVTQAADEGQT
jgi:type IV pilus assembly protein PilB